MDPVSITASAIAILQISGTIITACYNYRSHLKSAAKDASRIISELNGLRDIIESLFKFIEEEEASKANLQPSALEKLAKPGGPLARCAADLNDLEKKLEPKEGWRAVRAALIWPLKEGDVRKVLDEIHGTKSTVQLALASDQRKALSDINEGIGFLTKQISAVGISSRREKISRWLSAPDTFPSHVAARKNCQPETGQWFVKGRQFELFKETPGSFLWIYGIPGCGKTVLCSTIVEELCNLSPALSGTALAYFYFDFNDSMRRTVESLLRSVISQIFAQQLQTTSAVEALFAQSEESGRPVSLPNIFAAILPMIQSFSKVYLVIDALDECIECEELLQTLRTIQEWREIKLHLIVTSRQASEIEEVLIGIVTDRLKLHDSSIHEDIMLYLTQRLSNDRKLAKWPLDVRQFIWKKLSNKSDGMFRWVVCQLDTLKHCLTINSIMKELEILPRTLEETYERILLRIDDGNRQNALKLLQWLSFSARPVTVEEVAEVFAINWDGDPYYDPGLKLFEPRDLLLICSSLITTETVSMLDDSEIPSTYEEYHIVKYEKFEAIRLAHLSVKDFLLSDRIRSTKANFDTIDTRLANTFMAQTCIVYLLHPVFASGHCDWDVLYSRLREWPLYHYASHFWPFHVKALGETLDEKTWDLLQRFFQTREAQGRGNFGAWVVALLPELAFDEVQHTEPLYFAASFGVTSLIKKILEARPSVDINAVGGLADSSPLQIACYRGHFSAAKLLLEAGADPNVPDADGQGSLYWTMFLGYTEISDLLKTYGAVLTMQDQRRMMEASNLDELD